MRAVNLTVLRASIVSQFRPITLYYRGREYPARAVTGLTCRDVKDLFRGKVHQEQRAFVADVKAMGLTMSWSDPENAWVVHEKDTQGGLTEGE